MADPAPAPGSQPVEAPAAPTDDASPRALYEACEARLEQPETAGECKSNADCVPAGCSSERCISKASAEGLMGTCEVLPCFSVVDTCGCDQGLCRWTLKE